MAFQPRVMTALARDFAKVLNRCGDKYLAGRKWKLQEVEIKEVLV